MEQADRTSREDKNVTCVVFLPKMFNINLTTYKSKLKGILQSTGGQDCSRKSVTAKIMMAATARPRGPSGLKGTVSPTGGAPVGPELVQQTKKAANDNDGTTG